MLMTKSKNHTYNNYRAKFRKNGARLMPKFKIMFSGGGNGCQKNTLYTPVWWNRDKERVDAYKYSLAQVERLKKLNDNKPQKEWTIFARDVPPINNTIHGVDALKGAGYGEQKRNTWRFNLGRIIARKLEREAQPPEISFQTWTKKDHANLLHKLVTDARAERHEKALKQHEDNPDEVRDAKIQRDMKETVEVQNKKLQEVYDKAVHDYSFQVEASEKHPKGKKKAEKKQLKSKKLSSLDSPDNIVELVIPGMFALAFLLLAFVGLKKFHIFRKPMRGLHQP